MSDLDPSARRSGLRVAVRVLGVPVADGMEIIVERGFTPPGIRRVA
ncbi:hypothetical protein G3T14_13940 [Methylobacterium sp. BTF04]|nr:hypothetical protein [Methylobacterium sp. BTF04]NEU13226.1 hypothetical protein [Methylobacterium sp. BTF04]